MKHRAATSEARNPSEAGNPPRSWVTHLRAWSRRDEPEPVPDPGRPWPGWACWLISFALLFHITAVLACELANQVIASPLESDIGRRFWLYNVFTHQELAHAFFAPEPDPSTPVVTARLEFAGGGPDRRIRLPDRSARPRLRFLRQIALAWHLVHEWTDDTSPGRSYWAESYARHLCRSNPGCTRVSLFVEQHQMPSPRSVVEAVSRGSTPDLDALETYSFPQSLGAFSCDDFSAHREPR
jgi:hypothetical protein